MKRIISFVLAFVMVLSLVPAVSAAGGDLTAAVGVNGLTVTAGDTESVDNPGMPGAGDVEWTGEFKKITAVAKPIGERVSATLTFKNDSGIPATLRFEYSFTHWDENEYEEDRATVQGLSGDSGTFEKQLKNGEDYTITLISSYPDHDPATLTISGISLSTGGDVTATFTPADNGSYTVEGESITADTKKTAAEGTSYAVSATAASGYQFFGWSNGPRYISYKAEDKITITEDCTISPVFVKEDVAVFGVGIERFQSLSEANEYANSSAVKTIVLMNDGILTGEHTISVGNTLLIPYDAANTVHTEATSIATLSDTGNLWTNHDWEKPSAYRTLTMAAGAELVINGSLNVGGKHSSGPFLTAGSPSGDLGMIQMAEGSNITVNNGGTLYCWGYIYGGGTVTAKNGATVHENIQFTDFRGGNATSGIAQSFLVFPMTQYYVQNIEVATTYEYGAVEEVWGSIYVAGAGSKVYGTSVKFIGPDSKTAMFVPSNGGSVTKTYLPESDRLQLDINGDGSINPMTLDMEGLKEQLGGQALNTETFVLPITNNMTININSGTTSLNQSLALLPGTELTIAKDAKLFVNRDGEPFVSDLLGQVYNDGYNLIVYDRDQWLNAFTLEGEYIETYFVYNGKRLQPVLFTPSGSYTRTEDDLVDAVVDINGTLITDGFIYTTVTPVIDEETGEPIGFDGDTPVISSGKTGKVIMNNGAGQDMLTFQASQNGSEPFFTMLFMISARLQNEDGSYLDTMGAEAGATFSYCEKCGQWIAGNLSSHRVDVTWIVDGKAVTQEFCKGTKIVYGDGTDPVKDGYEFIGWSTENDNTPEYTAATLPNADVATPYWACFKEKTTGLLGDVNLDGNVDAYDVTALARHVGGIEEFDDVTALENSNVNRDGNVDAYDLTKLARYAGGIDLEL